MTDFFAWKPDSSRYFGTPDPAFEKQQNPLPADATFELVETSYFGFSIPEENIHCEIYHWAHPMLGITSGGIMIFRGKKSNQMYGDYINYRNYQPLPGDITDCTYLDGVKVRMIQPGEEFEISFDDPVCETSVYFNSKAIMPAAFRPNGGHFTQACKTTGTLVLHGKTHKIDSYFTRDRSWGDPRTETRKDIAPPGWHVGVFGDDLAFHVFAFESPELNPAQAKRYPGLENGKNLLWGYVWKNGKLLGIKSCQKRVRREADGLSSSEVQLTIVDENNEVHKINGVITARLPMSLFPNLTSNWALTRWTLEGDQRSGWGDTQEAFYPTFIRENCGGME